MKKLLDYLKDFLYPKYLTCAICHEEIDEANYLCKICRGSLQYQIGLTCDICGRMLIRTQSYKICDICKCLDRYMDGGSSVVVYDEMIKKTIFDLKYKGKKYLANVIAKMMFDQLLYLKIDKNFDLITSVAMYHKKEKKRGYNQAGLIGQALSEISHIPYEDVLIRNKATPSLNKIPLLERGDILKNIFESKSVQGRVLLVDDIITSGHTFNECAKALKVSGASYVYTLAFASSEQ